MHTKTLLIASAFVVSLAAAAPASAQQDDEREEETGGGGSARSGGGRSDGGGGGGRARGGGRGNVDIGTPHRGSRPFQLGVHGGFALWGFGVATGVRFGIPLMDNGFVDSINNAVYLNFGADFYFIEHNCAERDRLGRDCGYGPGFGFPITLHWEFYFNENWSAFAEIGANIFFHPSWLDGGRFGWYQPGAWFVWTIGGSFHISENFSLTLRVGSPYIAFGLTFQF